MKNTARGINEDRLLPIEAAGAKTALNDVGATASPRAPAPPCPQDAVQ